MHARLWRLVVACCLWASLLAVAQPVGADHESSFVEDWYQVERVIDGDSIRVRGIARDIRLAGVRAPEWDQRYGAEATKFTLWATMDLGEGWVWLEPAEIPYDGSTNRHRAYVWVCWGWEYDECGVVQEGLVKFGLAFIDEGHWRASGEHYQWLSQGQAEAKSRGCYLWRGVRCLS